MTNRKMTLEERVSALEKLCVVGGCDKEATKEHHIIPVVSGVVTREQPFDPTNNPKLDICDEHHDMIHEVEKDYGGYSHRTLIKAGIEKARNKDPMRRWGRKKTITDEQETNVVQLRKSGLSIRKISSEVGISTGSVHRILKIVQPELFFS